MFEEGLLDKILHNIKKLMPELVFDFFAPLYHGSLAYLGAFIYGFPSKKLKIIAVTGTKGKSTVVYMISEILDKSGKNIAAIGSLGFKIKDNAWPNNLKMTMPGRFKLQSFLKKAVDAGCEYVVLEVTSEGIKQKRHLAIDFDCAVFTNLHKEHIESHGSFENYYKAKQELFKKTKNIHIINADDPHHELFSKFPSKHTIFYGIKNGDILAENMALNINLSGEFNILNCLAALSVAAMYKIDISRAKNTLENIKYIPGRMEWVQKEPFGVVVDYAHTPESLEAVYKTLKESPSTELRMSTQMSRKLICVLGACGGGRDRWKRSEFGRIAAQYCDEIILTNEDPYDENPEAILDEIVSGFAQDTKYLRIIDRRDAIKKALTLAKDGDMIIITGKGSEVSMAVAGGKKIPWSDAQVVRDLL